MTAISGVLDVAVVGAGAAGLVTAIFAARRHARGRIVAFDGARQLGAKILVAGGGRCNVTNVHVTPADYWGGSRTVIRRVLAAFPVDRTRAFFGELGVALHEEEYGKLFPDTHQARTVLDALLEEARRRNIELRTGQRVLAIRRAAPGDPVEHPFQLNVTSAEGPREFRAGTVVLATGGRSLPRTGSDGAGYALAEALGHTVVPTTPALDPLRLEGGFHGPLCGISMPVELTVHTNGGRPVRVSGPLLWTHFGISGPAVLDASRHWHRAQLAARAAPASPRAAAPARITANFLPGLDFAGIETRVLELAAAQPRSQLHNALTQLKVDWRATGDAADPGLPARFVGALLAHLGIPGQVAMAQFDRAQRRRLVHALHAFELPIVGSRGYNYAEATAGGVPLSEIDPATMASRKCPGLHLVGEILDVDGRIGGFNFQWAWASGYVCGSTLALRPEQPVRPRAVR